MTTPMISLTNAATLPRLTVLALALAGGTANVLAQDVPANEIRAGAYFVSYKTKANDLSGPFTPDGINLRVANLTTAYFAYVRHLDAHWAVEVAGGVPPKAKTYGKGPATVGSVPFNDQEVATAKWFSPSVLVDYRFLDPSSAFHPYVGIGFNYTRFYELDSTPAGDAANGGPTHVHLSSSFGPAGTVGATYNFTREWSLLGAYSMARVNSNYRADTSGVIRTTSVRFNPRTFILAAAYSF